MWRIDVTVWLVLFLFPIQAINNAGLTAVVSSQSILFDASPPVPGRVFDGPRPVSGFWDLDYTVNHTHLLAHWEPFSDSHSVVTEYYWGVGTCPGCTDVTSYISVGLYTGAVIHYMHKIGAGVCVLCFYMLISVAKMYAGECVCI